MAVQDKCGPFVHNLATGNFKFGLDLYRIIAIKTKNPNLFLSPFSVSTALSMTLLGARGHTADQMMDVLKLNDIREHYQSAYREYLSLLENLPNGIDLSSANRLFINDNAKLIDQYVKDTETFFRAEAVLSDFANNARAEVRKINTWVESQTRNRIKDLISDISSDTALILVNAIYFKGKWTEQFLPRNTSKGSFFIQSDNEVQVDMMHLQEKFLFLHSDQLQCSILELPYAEGDLSMLILLPDQIEGLSDVEQRLNIDLINFNEVTKQTHKQTVLVSLPKFTLESSFNLERVLPDIGMRDLFASGRCDLSGIDGTLHQYISQMVHKTFLEVNEEGSEAAAATAMVCVPTCLPVQMIQVFKADHPFMFLIQDNRSNMTLFIGRFTNPAQ